MPSLFVLFLAAPAACGSEAPAPVLPDVAAAAFVAGVDNPYFPLSVGATWTYEAGTEEGIEQAAVEMLAETRQIQGVEATVVRDTVTLKGWIIEDTSDRFAQDSGGNVRVHRNLRRRLHADPDLRRVVRLRGVLSRWSPRGPCQGAAGTWPMARAGRP